MTLLFNKENTHKKIFIKHLEETYKAHYSFSILEYVEKFHPGLEYIKLNICQKTGTEYYTPRSFYGNQEYYKAITDSSEYYKKERWEWNSALELLNNKTNILEIGCGKGAFIKKASKHGYKVVGIDPSHHSQQEYIYKETIEEHILNNPSTKYDVIVSFHVLEHIADIDAFFKSIELLLKEDGFLLIAVPNNNSFIRRDPINIMNMPPHHLNLWTPSSIKNTLLYYGFNNIQIILNKLPPDHHQWYFQVYYNVLRDKLGLIGRIISKVTKPLIIFSLKVNILKPDAAEMFIKVSRR